MNLRARLAGFLPTFQPEAGGRARAKQVCLWPARCAFLAAACRRKHSVISTDGAIFLLKSISHFLVCSDCSDARGSLPWSIHNRLHTTNRARNYAATIQQSNNAGCPITLPEEKNHGL
jgi:hypothetical protein